MKEKMVPVEVARRLVTHRFPDTICAFAAGSFRRGEETATSDIDLVVIIEGGAAPFRESLHAEDWPIEAFVHTRESLRLYFARDAAARTPSLPFMCVEGETLLDRVGIAREIQAEARAILDAGPAPMTGEHVEDRRYCVTDLPDDFLGCQRRDEGILLATALATSAVDLLLALHGQWTGHGKWLPRALERFDPLRRMAMEEAIDAYCRQDDKLPLVALAENVLNEAGGGLFDGYRRGGETE